MNRFFALAYCVVLTVFVGNVRAELSSFTFRGGHNFLVQPQQDGRIVLDIHYEKKRKQGTPMPLALTLKSFSGKVLLQKKYPCNRDVTIDATTDVQGPCELSIRADSVGVFYLKTSSRLAINGLFHGFGCLPKLYFFVPANSQSTVLISGGGKKENVAWRLEGDDKKIALQGDTGADGVNSQFDVPVSDEGRIWCVQLDKTKFGHVEDFYIGVRNNVSQAASCIAVSSKDISVREELPGEIKKQLSSVLKMLEDGSKDSQWRDRLKKQYATQLKEWYEGKFYYTEFPEISEKIAAITDLVYDWAEGKLPNSSFLYGPVRAVTNQHILPNDPGFPAQWGEPIRIVAAGDEFEPASFIVRSETDLTNVTLNVGTLTSQNGTVFPADDIDVRIVKSWYQVFRSANGRKILVPELLLHDDDLVKVDLEQGHNYIRLSQNKNTPKYVCISTKDGVPFRKKEEFSVKDASKLQAFDLQKNRIKQFWITAHVLQSTSPGTYRGEITLNCEGKNVVRLPLELRVLPFVLPEPYYTSSIYYYRPSSDFYGKGLTQQYRRELENLRSHGVTNVPFPFKIDQTELLKIYKDAGMGRKDAFFYRGWYPHYQKGEDRLEKIRQRVQHIIDTAKKFGYEDVYFYGIDEATGDRLRNQREAWEVIREAGGKIFVSGYKGVNSKEMVDIQDMLVSSGSLSRQEAACWHERGHKIFSYGNPQGRDETPETYRRNFGLLLWQYHYDGAMTYIYHWGNAQHWNNKKEPIKKYLPCTWNDFCRTSDHHKQHNMVYPTADGVVDTCQWEGYREGVDDVRYLTALEAALKEAGESSDPATQEKVRKFQSRLADLRKGDINWDNIDPASLRQEFIEMILELNDHGKK